MHLQTFCFMRATLITHLKLKFQRLSWNNIFFCYSWKYAYNLVLFHFLKKVGIFMIFLLVLFLISGKATLHMLFVDSTWTNNCLNFCSTLVLIINKRLQFKHLLFYVTVACCRCPHMLPPFWLITVACMPVARMCCSLILPYYCWQDFCEKEK